MAGSLIRAKGVCGTVRSISLRNSTLFEANLKEARIDRRAEVILRNLLLSDTPKQLQVKRNGAS